MSDVIQVRGLSELQRFLDQLPAKMERNVLRGALRAGARLVQKAARANVPVSPPNARNARRYNLYAGALRDTLRVSAQARGGQVTASVKAGGKTKGGAVVYYARWVEYGTRSHWISVGDGGPSAATANRWERRGRLRIGENFVGSSVVHPGAQARPYLRPALDSQATAAVVAVGEYIKGRLAMRYGLDTADVVIEAEEG